MFEFNFPKFFNKSNVFDEIELQNIEVNAMFIERFCSFTPLFQFFFVKIREQSNYFLQANLILAI